METCRVHLGLDREMLKDNKMALLDGISDVRTRCLIAVLLGNDQFPPELKWHSCFHGIGLASVRDMLKKARARSGGQQLDILVDVCFDDLLAEAFHRKDTKKNGKPTSNLSQLVRLAASINVLTQPDTQGIRRMKSVMCWEHAELTFRMNKRVLLRAFDNKLMKVMETVNAWPRFAYHDKDNNLRSDKWREHYQTKRVIMWDNTNVDFQGKPSDARL